VRGFGWPEQSDDPRLELRNDRPEGVDYAKAINATKINLGFLRKIARDEHTTRSVEIPACRAFLLAERTGEHLDLFEEGVEAEFFDDVDEAARKIQRYLRDEQALHAVAEAGYRRCIDSGYSNLDRLSWALDRVQEIEI
jgi:spore maturation protein CgeB